MPSELRWIIVPSARVGASGPHSFFGDAIPFRASTVSAATLWMALAVSLGVRIKSLPGMLPEAFLGPRLPNHIPDGSAPKLQKLLTTTSTNSTYASLSTSFLCSSCDALFLCVLCLGLYGPLLWLRVVW